MSDNLNVDTLKLPLAVPTPEIEWAAIRARRDQFLRATDFTQLPDYPGTETQKAELTAFRKALRNIPEQASEPSNVVWPVVPAFMK